MRRIHICFIKWRIFNTKVTGLPIFSAAYFWINMLNMYPLSQATDNGFSL